jgi:hypothetical protein
MLDFIGGFMYIDLEFTRHAEDSGINMTGKLAIPVSESVGRLLMIDVIDPVTRDVVIPSGVTLDIQLIDVCESYGIDYVVVYKHAHSPS